MNKDKLIKMGLIFSLLIIAIMSIIILLHYNKEVDDSEEIVKQVKDMIDETITPEPTLMVEPTEEPTPTLVDSSVGKTPNIPTDERTILYDDSEEESDYDEEPTDNGSDKPKVQKKYTVVCDNNDDYVGWITVPDTRIDYPVVLNTEDPEYYLHRNFYKQDSYAGTPFCYFHTDIERPSDNIMIYGHNMKSGTMFHDLHKFKEKSFYETHKTFNFNSIYEDGTYEIIAVLLTDANAGNYEKYTVLDFSETTYTEFINYLKENSLYETEGIKNAKYGDKLVSLCTCAYHTDNGRIVLIGRKIS